MLTSRFSIAIEFQLARRAKPKFEPLAVKIHTHLATVRRSFFQRLDDDEILADLGQKAFAIKSVEVLNDPIVGQNVEILRREHPGDDEVVFFVTRVTGVRFPHLIAGELGAFRTVMPVCDVDRGQFTKGLDPRVRFGLSPNFLCDALQRTRNCRWARL